MSQLNGRATELIGVLQGILKCLEIYQADISSKYADLLRPLIDDFEHTVFIKCSVAEAKDALYSINALMSTINGASSKGGCDFFPYKSDLLNHYWNLETIFRESRYSKMNLSYSPENHLT